MAKKFIQGAIKKPGAFSAQAKKAHMSTMAYARKEQHAPGVTGRRARLALTLNHLRPSVPKRTVGGHAGRPAKKR